MSRPALYGALAFWAAVYLAVWYRITFSTYPGFWLVDEEMAVHSLGHAVYLDNWLAAGNGHANSFFQFLHPGLPLQMFSWLAYRLTASDPLASAEELFQATLIDPEPFHLATQCLGMATILLGLFLVWRQLRPAGGLASFVALALPFACAGNWAVGFWRLDSETFALVLAAGYAACLAMAFGEAPGGKPRKLGWFWLGMILGAAYLNKVSHIPWFVGAGAGWLAWLMASRGGWRAALSSAVSVLAGGFVSGCIGLVLMGPRQFYQMLHLHWRIATHRGVIGEGTAGLVDQRGIVLPTDPAVYLAAGLVLLICLGFWVKRSRADWLAKQAPMGAALGTALLAGLLVLLRQQWDHYFSPTAALMPFAAFWLFRAIDKRLAYLLLLAPLAAIGPIENSLQRADARPALAGERLAEIDEFLSLGLEDGQIRIWSFKVQSPHYLRRLAVEQSGARHLTVIVDQLQPNDFDFNIWKKMMRRIDSWHQPDDFAWRYAIFERRYFKRPADLPESFRKPGYRIVERKHHIWVERPPSLFSQLSAG